MVKIGVIFLMLCVWVGADPVTATGRVPLRPADGIYDPSDWLESESRTEMVKNILEARETGKSAVFVVILEEVPDEPRQMVDRWGRKWGKGGLWGMVLHVPGEGGFPKAYAGLSRDPAWGDEEKRSFMTSLEEALAKASQSTGTVDRERPKVEMATRAMAEGIGYLGVVIQKIDRRVSQARWKSEESTSSGKRKGTTSLLWSIGIPALILLAVILLFLVFRGEEDEVVVEDFLFPETEPRKRFRAPWSGGGNVLIEFSKRRGS